MNGPRFLPSGNRLGPYFCRRVVASAASRPLPASVARRFNTSSADIACHAATSLAVLGFAAVLMLVLRSLPRTMGSQYHLSSGNCRLVRHNHDPGRDPAKPDDLWTRRIPIRRLLEARTAMRRLVRRGRDARGAAGLEVLSCTPNWRAPWPYLANSSAAFSATTSMRSSCAVIIPKFMTPGSMASRALRQRLRDMRDKERTSDPREAP